MKAETIFTKYSLKLVENVAFNNAAIFRPAHREAAQDCKPSIQVLLNAITAHGDKPELIEGLVILEKYLMELTGNTSVTEPQDVAGIQASFNSRRACHPSYAGKTITQSAAKRAAILGVA